MDTKQSLQFRQLSVAHQAGLDLGLDVSEVFELSLEGRQIKILYGDREGKKSVFYERKEVFIDKIEHNCQALYVNCEYKKSRVQQYILMSRKMGHSLGITPIKDFTKVSLVSTDFDYLKCVTLTNSLVYKSVIEQKAILYSWEVFEYLGHIAKFRELAFRTRYSQKNDIHRSVINDLERSIMSAYESIDFEKLQTSLCRVEILDKVLPLDFIESVRRIYLEIIKCWLLVNAEMPSAEIDLERSVRYVNAFQIAPFVLRGDANWQNVKDALSYFVPGGAKLGIVR